MRGAPAVDAPPYIYESGHPKRVRCRLLMFFCSADFFLNIHAADIEYRTDSISFCAFRQHYSRHGFPRPHSVASAVLAVVVIRSMSFSKLVVIGCVFANFHCLVRAVKPAKYFYCRRIQLGFFSILVVKNCFAGVGVRRVFRTASQRA